MNSDWFLYLFTGLLSTAAVLAGGIPLLAWLKQHGCRQYIRDDGPNRHLAKAGTPTMGGLLFVPVFVVLGLLIAFITKHLNFSLLLLGLLTLAFMALGLTDDMMMLRRKGSLGLKARHKLLLQFIFAGLFLYALDQTGSLRPFLRVPFAISWIALPHWVYYIFSLIFIVGFSNSTNLSDGLDGLLAGLSIIAAAALAITAYWLGNSGIAIFSCALGGACLGFLYYNRYPACVFMGDTGSLALGAAFAGLAILAGAELLFFLFGLVFLLESLSVIIQVIVYKRTGRRVFKMSPVHHHFELSGWKETRVVAVFWATSAAITIAALIMTHIGWKLSW